MSFSTRHLDRERAESFGTVAEEYEHYRPDFPQALVDDLAQLTAANVLDVGCGTGKAAAALAGRGFSVLGLEPDERMARFAQRKGIPVEISNFETWQAGDRRFDLIISADAWHWIDPISGARQAAKLLSPGGHIARFWSFYELDSAILDEFDDIYRECARETQVGGGRQKSTEGVHDPLVNDTDFVAVTQRNYHWELTMNADEWIGLITTFSDHQRLAPPDRAVLFARLRAAIEHRGGAVRATAGTFLQLARRI
ncbi:class I SAM-dependent methyltransferase [Nocardia sp. NPDC004604]|uniref:class I SAM-dependent methyltransferase n=1 Tax=Nocardia sp. NPDC004604 TaxID=3157013 RepID=UPI0033A659AB